MNIYVGNLPYNTTKEELRRLFSTFGSVWSVKIISDSYTGKPKGFGFVVMTLDDEAEIAISKLNGNEFKGRTLRVVRARSQEASIVM